LPQAPSPARPDAAKPSPANESLVRQKYGELPLSFEANDGQTDSQVRFLARGPSYTLSLTATEAVMVMSKPAAAPASGAADSLAPEVLGRGGQMTANSTIETVTLRMQFVDGNQAPQVVGREQLPGTVNYFVGNNPDQWHTNVPTYARVEYQQVYPGIDLVYYGNQRQLEYDFVIAPGADPGAIHMRFAGADGLEVDAQGELVLQTAAGPVVQHRPVVYQEVSGMRQEVAGRYVLAGSGEVGFELGAYDPNRPLVIDPVMLSYSTYLGITGFDEGNGIAVDSAGNAYVTGSLGGDAFVSKLNAGGTRLVYLAYLRGNGAQAGWAITVDGAGNAYVTGQTNATDFPTTAGAFQTAFGGGPSDAFVTKLNATGTALVYSTYLGGSARDQAYGIAVDGAGNAYVTGYTESTDFPTTEGAFQTVYGGGVRDAFVAQLSADGTALAYSTYLGGSAHDEARAITVDSAGNAYVTGFTASTDFPTTEGAFQPAHQGDFVLSAFVTKLSGDGTALVYSTYLGGSGGYDVGYGIAVDGAGNAYVTGGTGSIDFPTTPGAFQTTLRGTNAFVSKLSGDGTALVYSTYLGGSGGDTGGGVAVDGAGNAYVAGSTSSNNFPTTPGAFQTSNRGGVFDAFVSKLSGDGTALVYSTYLGGFARDQALGIALDGAGNAYVTGFTNSTNFPTTPGAFQTAFRGSSPDSFNAFVAKLTAT
jgi:hypothetical protein